MKRLGLMVASDVISQFHLCPRVSQDLSQRHCWHRYPLKTAHSAKSGRIQKHGEIFLQVLETRP